jgi:hypothetical protein
MEIFKKKNSNNPYYTKDIPLSELANKYETDKGTANSLDLAWGVEYPNHQCWHYTSTYEKYMSTKKTYPINMLEIGVCDKRFPYASIKMWMSYFNDINFYAIDNFWGSNLSDKIDEIETLTNNGINFIYADQGSIRDWDEINTQLPNMFDFIIEDGSHWPNHMMITLWKSIGIMKKGGLYFMEDIQNPLTSRGWFKYDNSLLCQELQETLSTKILYSSFLNDQQNKDIQNNFELVDLVLDPTKINYLAVLKRI